jgi:hypothetical protein
MTFLNGAFAALATIIVTLIMANFFDFLTSGRVTSPEVMTFLPPEIMSLKLPRRQQINFKQQRGQ